MDTVEAGPLLKGIDVPADLRLLAPEQLPRLCGELRRFIIDTVSLYGGHFAAGLGVVELTVALHYVFQTPADVLVWDVGHQAYAHKLLTGRRSLFSTNRKWNGLSGFPKRSESVFDTFGVGHSSTSVSAALGMAIADKIKGNTERQHIAVIGDGALTAGLSFEALNHAGVSDTNITIVVNDNNMSIDPNVGGLTRLFAAHNGEAAKYFEALGLKYYGPVDGHDVPALLKAFEALTALDFPKILHVKTVKGKGYLPAEQDQTKWHATAAFDKLTGQLNQLQGPGIPQPPKYQDVFGKTILALAKRNPLVMGITPAMPSGSSLKIMIDEMPDRAIDVGIAEQHAVTLSAGLATQGMKVFCNIYSTFMQRAYDMVIHDVAIQDLPVIFCLDRAGLVGEDGATHQGAYDLAYMRCIPNMIVSAPMNEAELRNLMYTAQLLSTRHPFVIRYPRGKGVLTDWELPFEEIEIGKGRMVQEGTAVAVLSLGHPGNFVVEACRLLAQEQIFPAHFDMRFVKPLDEDLLMAVGQSFDKVITVEDGCIRGGFGAAVLEWLNDHDFHPKVIRLGIPDRVIEQGRQQEQLADCGFDTNSILNAIRDLWKK